MATGGVTVTGGLTLSNGTVVKIDAASFQPSITFQGDQTIGGSGQLQFAGPGGEMQVLGNVTLDPGITVHGTTGYLTIGSGSLINQGTITADGGGTIYFDIDTGTSWSNAPGGILQAKGGGTISFDSTTASWTNAAGGVLQAEGGGTLSLSGAWSNSGSIVVQNATLNLGGSFSTAGLGSYTPTGGTINLTGTLDNTGATLILDAATGSWNLEGGTLEGGALATLDGTDLATGDYGGSLAGLTLGATVAGQAEPGNLLVATGGVTVTGGLTLANGTVVEIDAASFQPVITFEGNQTIGGSGQIQFAGPGVSCALWQCDSRSRGHRGRDEWNNQHPVRQLLNQGTIDSDAGGTLSIQGSAGTPGRIPG